MQTAGAYLEETLECVKRLDEMMKGKFQKNDDHTGIPGGDDPDDFDRKFNKLKGLGWE